MPSSRLHSADKDVEQSELSLMRRRFFEALRRAEVITMINAADDEPELGREFSEELCEAFESEIAFLIEGEAPGAEARVIATVGLQVEQGLAMLAAPLCLRALDADAPLAEYGKGLLGTGARGALLASFRGQDGRRVLAGVARLYDEPFDEAETALLGAATAAVGNALGRIWAIEEREQLIDQLKESFIGAAEALANALEAKDLYTADHARSIAELAVAVGEEMGLPANQLEDLRYGAIFHDIGKIAVPDALLQKRGSLSAEEWEVMRRHPVHGERLVAEIDGLEHLAAAVRGEHERWDGAGYPDGLAGEEIPMASRIVFVCDAYDAMRTDRPYRQAMAEEAALAEIRAGLGSQFCPDCAQALLDVLAGAEVLASAEAPGVDARRR